MNLRMWRRWGLVGLLAVGTVITVLVGLRPLHRAAQQTVAATEGATRELEAKTAMLAALPGRQSTLDELASRLATFRATLHRTNDIETAMTSLTERAKQAGITMWTVDPSLPTLLALSRAKDSVAMLDLALLPVAFECRGDFLMVGRFLEAEERRTSHCRWTRLLLTPGSEPGTVHARAEVLIYLLPATREEGGATG